MEANRDEDEIHSAMRVKREADSQLYHHIDFGLRIARVIYLIIAISVAASVWLSALQWQVGANTRAHDKLEKQRLDERLNATEKEGDRRDKQLRALWRDRYGVDPF